METNNRAIAGNLARFESGEMSIEELLGSGNPEKAAPATVAPAAAEAEDEGEFTLEDLTGEGDEPPVAVEEEEEDPDDFSSVSDESGHKEKRRLTSAERNAKRREKEKAFQARIEHLEAELARKSAIDANLQQQVAEHQSHFQSAKNYQLDNEVEVREANLTRIQQELIQANMNYDSAKQVELQNRFIEEKFALRDAQTKRDFIRTQQPVTNQAPQRANVDQELFASRVNEFVSRYDHKWMGSEFNAQGQPLTEDAQRAIALVSRMANAGGDVRTKSFWDGVDTQLREVLPSRYVKRYGQKTSPTVSGAGQSRGNGSTAKVTDIDRQAFEMLQTIKQDRPFENKAAEKAFFMEYRKNLLAAAKRN